MKISYIYFISFKRKRNGISPPMGGAAFPAFFGTLLPSFPSFGWCCFFPFALWVVLFLLQVLLGWCCFPPASLPLPFCSGALPCAIKAGAVLSGTSTTQRTRRKAAPTTSSLRVWVVLLSQPSFWWCLLLLSFVVLPSPPPFGRCCRSLFF